MNNFDFDKENSALLIINMQNAFLHSEGSLATAGLHTQRMTNAIEPIRQLKEAFRAENRPVIYVQHIHDESKATTRLMAKIFPPIMNVEHCIQGSWDSQIIDELAPQEDDFIVKKHRFSGFYQTGLTQLLEELNIENLVVTGVATNMCVEATVRDAFYRDLNVFVPEEATASFTRELEQGALKNFDFAFARVLKVKEVLYEMLMLVI